MFGTLRTNPLSRRPPAWWPLGLFLILIAVPRAQGQAAVRPSAAPLPYDSTTVRALLAEGIVAAQRAPLGERSSLLAALGRTQVSVRDYTGATRTLGLVGDESPGKVLRQLGQTERFAGFERAGLARRLSCALYEANRPDSALATIRAMRPGAEREWELAHAASMLPGPEDAAATRPSAPATRWASAFELAREVSLPAARLDALLSIARSVPDTGIGRETLERVYLEARRITLVDMDRQRSRDAMLAEVALRLGRSGDAETLFARLAEMEDLAYVLDAAVQRRNDGPLVRTFAPRVVRVGRAIRDSAAREVFLTRVWRLLHQAGGRGFADSLLPEATARAEHRVDLRAALDSAAAADTTPAARARRALDKRDFAEVRRQMERLPLDDRRARKAELWANMAWAVYGGHRDTARAYLREARAALAAVPRDSATFDERAVTIANHQFWLGDHEEGIRTLNLIHAGNAARGVIGQWGTSTFSGLSARRLRDYADRVRNPEVRDAVLARIVSGYLVGTSSTDADAAWARALAESIATPTLRSSARRAVANEALRRGDSTDARRRILALLGTSTPSPAFGARGRQLTGDLVHAGGWREAIEWARAHPDPAERARRLLEVATLLQGAVDERNGGGRFSFSNGPDRCRDTF